MPSLPRIDIDVCLRANHVCARRGWRAVFAVASRLGDGGAWYALMALLIVFDGRDGLFAASHLAITGAIALALYAVLKRWTRRPRPFASDARIHAWVAPLDEFSFSVGAYAARGGVHVGCACALSGVGVGAGAVRFDGRGVARGAGLALPERCGCSVVDRDFAGFGFALVRAGGDVVLTALPAVGPSALPAVGPSALPAVGPYRTPRCWALPHSLLGGLPHSAWGRTFPD